MKVDDILNEMSDEEVIGDTGEKPVLSPEMQKRKEADQAKIRAERDASRRMRGNRLRGRGGRTSFPQGIRER